MNAEIIAVGSELLTPFRQDTNSLFLTRRLNEFGVEVGFKGIVGDSLEHIRDVTRTALWRADILIFTGGLGPTEDDLTREGVAAALGVDVYRDADILAKLYARFASRHLTNMPRNNEKQADVVKGATVLANPAGTAPGQWIDTMFEGRPRIIVLLPGPPWELEKVWEAECVSRFREKLPPAFIATRSLRVAMLPIHVRCAYCAHLQAVSRCPDHNPGGCRRYRASFAGAL